MGDRLRRSGLETHVQDMENFPTEILQKIYEELGCLSKIDGSCGGAAWRNEY